MPPTDQTTSSSVPPVEPNPPQPPQGKGGAPVLALVVPALVLVAFLFRGPIGDALSNAGHGEDSSAVKNAKAYAACIADALHKVDKQTGKASLELGQAKTDDERVKEIENADLTPEERKQIFADCRSLFPAGVNEEKNAHIILVEGDHDDPVAQNVAVAIEAGGRYISPGSDGEALVPYLPAACGKNGCALSVQASSSYELVSPLALDKDGLAQQRVKVKLRPKDQQLVIALGPSRVGTPHVWVEGTNAEARLWSTACQPNDRSDGCRKVQATDGNATFGLRGKLSSLSVRLSKDGDDWGSPIEIADAASAIKDGILRVPEPAVVPAHAAPPCVTDGNWFKNRVRQFAGWKESRQLKLSAAVSADGVVELKSTPPLAPEEQSELREFLGKPTSATAGCSKAPVTAQINAHGS